MKRHLILITGLTLLAPFLLLNPSTYLAEARDVQTFFEEEKSANHISVLSQLEGNPNAPAVETAIRNYYDLQAHPEDYAFEEATGLLVSINTMGVAFEVGVTVAEVNDILSDIRAEILGVLPTRGGRLILTVRVPTQTHEEIITLAESLEERPEVDFATEVVVQTVFQPEGEEEKSADNTSVLSQLEGKPNAPAAGAIPDLGYSPRDYLQDYSREPELFGGAIVSFNTVSIAFRLDATVSDVNAVLSEFSGEIVGGMAGIPGKVEGILIVRLPTQDHYELLNVIEAMNVNPKIFSVAPEIVMQPATTSPTDEEEMKPSQLEGNPNAPAVEAIGYIDYYAELYPDDYIVEESTGGIVSINTLIIAFELSVTVAEVNRILGDINAKILGATPLTKTGLVLTVRVPTQSHEEVAALARSVEDRPEVRYSIEIHLEQILQATEVISRERNPR